MCLGENCEILFLFFVLKTRQRNANFDIGFLFPCVLTKWCYVKRSFCQHVTMLAGHFVNRLIANWLFCKLVILSWQLVIFVNWPFCQLVILSPGHFVTWSICHWLDIKFDSLGGGGISSLFISMSMEYSILKTRVKIKVQRLT